MRNSVKNISQFLLIGVLMPTALAFGAGKTDGKKELTEAFVPGRDSYRASFELNVPRRYATRYLSETRSLELRVSPARASEFDVSRYYDTRYIHRVVMEEKSGDVVLSFQLKNAPIAWLVTNQSNPWRLIVDIWRTEPVEVRSVEQEWKWQEDAAGTVRDSGLSEPAVSGKQQITSARSTQSQTLSGDQSRTSRVGPIEMDFSATSTETSTTASSPNATQGHQLRLENIVALSSENLAMIERQVGADEGSIREFDSLEKLATALYRSGRTRQAIPLFRRLAVLNGRRLQDSPRLLWMAGESAYLDGQAELANDYFQTLVSRFDSHEIGALGQLRLLDLKREKLGDPEAQNLSERYGEIATNANAPWAARIGAALRLLEPTAVLRPEAAAVHQAALQNCVNGTFVTPQIRQNCAYIQTRYAVHQMDVVSADKALQRFRSIYANDPRGSVLEADLTNRAKFIVDEYARKKDFESLAALEKSARPGLMDFTLREPVLLMARVDAWLSVGEARKALNLLQVFAASTTDETKRNEAHALSAQLYHKLQQPEKAESALKKIYASDVRKNTGLTDRASAALRESARVPYSSKTAQAILIDELKFGRYVERDIGMLVTLADAARGREDADKLFDILITTSPRNEEDSRRIEGSLFSYADDLRNNGRLAKAGDVYMTVANLAQTSKKAEASYKAGLVYARAGMVEKAKSAWQISAADMSDKKFSSLASERLERIR